MKKLLAITALSLLTCSVQAQKLAVCTGQYALCAASSATPLNETITVNGKVFKKGLAVCPVLNGDSIADLNLMSGSCTAPAGKVWSLFSSQSNYPQAPTWETLPAQFRSFTTTKEYGGGMSNMWSFLCDIQPKTVNGVKLANCYGPINESPWDGHHVLPGEQSATQAPVGAINPVGGPLPVLPKGK
jgi:hypothetical protein